jgi:hypothetical protein
MSARTIPNPGRATVRPPGLGGITVELSTFIPPGNVIVLGPSALEVLGPTGNALWINPATRDRFGSPHWLVRAIDPHPGYTRHALGERELERELRRRSRPVKFH